MPAIDKFLERYNREFDFYLEAARLAAGICETELVQNGIRAIVTHRAKSPVRLRDKVIARDLERAKPYRSVDQIYRDIVDLAGVRVALYFPGDVGEVERVIRSLFEVQRQKVFPDVAEIPPYDKRFSGYAARHYHVSLRTSDLPESNQRHSDARIEIQVASVLMHAWSEVEHDLVYKPLSGTLSEDEYAILDELNGLVLAGEIALERLQRAGHQRVRTEQKNFSNHYELASYIFDKAQYE